MLRRKRFWFGIIIALSFLAFFLARTDLDEISSAFAGVDLLLALAGVPLYFFGFWLRTIRWRTILGPVTRISTARLYPVVLIGLMTNNIAPARVGELVRAYLLGERESMSKSTALGTIAVDRTFDGLTLVAMLGVVVAASGADAAVKGVGVATALLFAAAAAVLVALAFSPKQARGYLLRFLRLLPRSLAFRLEELVDSFLSGLVALRRPRTLLVAGLFSFASWLTEGTMYFVVGEAFQLDVAFHVYLIIVAAANLALSVFASPGGVGPFEVATREVLVFFGVGGAAASAYALALHVLLLAPVVLVGFVLLWAAQLSLHDLLGVPKGAAAAAPNVSGRPE